MFGCLLLLILCIECTKSVSISQMTLPSPCELRDAYGCDNIPNNVDQYDWVLASGPTPSGSPTASTSTESVAGNADTTDDNCYLLHTPHSAGEGNTAVLVSSCFIPEDSISEHISLQFVHITYGQPMGNLSVYLRQGCVEQQLPEEDDRVWTAVGSQTSTWTNEQLTLNITPIGSFQILFEAAVGNDSIGYIALDGISINGVTCFEDGDFLCDNSNCIPDYWLCDGINTPDCIDGTDEAAATCCDPMTMFMCHNGRCIDGGKVCDGKSDCSPAGENEDETNCLGTTEQSATSASGTSNPMYSYEASSKNTTTIQSTGVRRTSSVQREDVTMDYVVNKTYSFCDRNLIIGGIDNCSFIAVIAIIFVILVIFLSVFVYKRHLEAPSRKESEVTGTTFVETGSNSAIQDHSEFQNAFEGHDNATVLDTISQTGKENVSKIDNTEMSTTTFGHIAHNVQTDPESKTSDKDKTLKIYQNDTDMTSVNMTTTSTGNMNEANGTAEHHQGEDKTLMETGRNGSSSAISKSGYEDVNVGDVKPPGPRRPTLPDRDLFPEPLIKDPNPNGGTLSNTILPPPESLTSTEKQVSNHSPRYIPPQANGYNASDDIQNPEDIKRGNGRRKSSCKYFEIDDSPTLYIPQDNAYGAITKKNPGRPPTLPPGHPAFTVIYEDPSETTFTSTAEDIDIVPSFEGTNGDIAGLLEVKYDATVTSENDQYNQYEESTYVIQQSALIDHKGKNMDVPGTSVRLDVPEGSIPDGQAIDVTLSVHWGEEFYPPLENNQVVIGPSICCQPHNTHFLKPVTLTIPHSAGKIDSRYLAVWTNKSQTLEDNWQLLFDGNADHCYENIQGEKLTVRITDESVKIRVSHFSWFTTLLSYFTDTDSNTQALSMEMIPYMNPPSLKDTNIIHIKLYALREDQPRESIEDQEKKVCGVQCGETTPFVLQLNGDDIDCHVKVVKAPHAEDNWNPMDDRKTIMYDVVRRGKYGKCAFTLTKNQMNITDIDGQINAYQAHVEKPIVQDAIFSSQMVPKPDIIMQGHPNAFPVPPNDSPNHHTNQSPPRYHIPSGGMRSIPISGKNRPSAAASPSYYHDSSGIGESHSTDASCRTGQSSRTCHVEDPILKTQPQLSLTSRQGSTVMDTLPRGSVCHQRELQSTSALKSDSIMLPQDTDTGKKAGLSQSRDQNSSTGHTSEPLFESLKPFKMKARGDLSNPFLEVVARGIHSKWRDLAFKLGFCDEECEEFASGDNSPGAFWPAFRMLDHLRVNLSENEVKHGRQILADAIQSIDENLHDKIVNW